METETNNPDSRDTPQEPVNPIKKKEEEQLNDVEQESTEDPIEQSHEIDPHKSEEDPTTFLPFGGE
jgi:hypothetical protein